MFTYLEVRAMASPFCESLVCVDECPSTDRFSFSVYTYHVNGEITDQYHF